MKKKIFIFGVSFIVLLSSAVFSQVTISGTVTSGGSGLENVVMSGLPGNPLTNASGFYTATVASGWSGTVTPTLAGYTFVPPAATYTNISIDQTTGYTATKQYFTIENVLIPADRRANPITIIPVDFNSDGSIDFLVTQMSGGDFLPVPVLAFRTMALGISLRLESRCWGICKRSGRVIMR